MTPADINSMVDNSLTWRDLEWLRSVTSLPLLVKGILTAEDAALAVEARSRRHRRLEPRRPPARRRARRRWTRCRRSSRRSATRPRCCSTAASAVAPTSSRRSRWAPAPCSWDARRSTGSRSEAPTASSGCSSLLREEIELALALLRLHVPHRGHARARCPGRRVTPVLYEPEAFEPLTDEPWDAGRVGRRDAPAIVADADAACRPEAPVATAHEWDGWQTPEPMTGLYVGAAGVVWALDGLRGAAMRRRARPRRGCAAHARSLAREAGVRGIGDVPKRAPAALYMGESRLLLAAWRVEPSEELADRLLARVRENVESPANEVMWGAPGTMLAAGRCYEWTGEERWAEALRESAEAASLARDADGLWPNVSTVRRTGGSARRTAWSGTPCTAAAGSRPRWVRAARTGDCRDSRTRPSPRTGSSNWPGGTAGRRRPAPAVVRRRAADRHRCTAVSRRGAAPAGAELAWQAGPSGVEKGSSLCHGTAGNG